MVDAATSSIRTIAGDGTEGFGGDGGLAKDAQLQRPAAVEVDADGSTLYIADTRNERLRAVDLTTGTITTIAGVGGPAVAYDPALIGLQTPTPQLSGAGPSAEPAPNPEAPPAPPAAEPPPAPPPPEPAPNPVPSPAPKAPALNP